MKIKFNLSASSIDAAIKQVTSYRDDLPRKAEEIRQRVAKLLQQMVKDGFNGAKPENVVHGKVKVPDVNVTFENGDKVSVVVAHGKEAVFIEFGAGVYDNPGGSIHPSRPPGIVQIGEYGKGYGKRQVWGFYAIPGDKDSLVLTHGTPASAPMFYAAKAVAEKVPEIAREVFKGGVSA